MSIYGKFFFSNAKYKYFDQYEVILGLDPGEDSETSETFLSNYFKSDS